MSEYLYGKSGQCITFENSETACKWRDFDNECLSVADDEDADLYPHGTTTTTTNITTTTTTTITTTTHPRFRQLKNYSKSKLMQVSDQQRPASTKHIGPHIVHSQQPVKNYFNRFLYALYRFKKGTLLGVERGQMQRVAYKLK